MLPHDYGLPAAVLLVLAGALSCFAGYRLFRIVLGIWGFILGAMLASSIMGVNNAGGMVAAGLIGGLAGALVLVFAYFIGIALIGAAFGVFIAHMVWGYVSAADPHWAAIVFASVAGAIAAMALQRYVIIVSTSFAGAWTIIVGGLAVASDLSNRQVVRAASAPDVWILYPLSPSAGGTWVPFAWIILGLIGTAVQLGVTARKDR
jgi:hypothetical protein